MKLGPLDAKLWIICDCPDQDDIAAQRPFSDFAGRYFVSLLQDLQVPLHAVRVEYLVSEVAPKNEFRFFELEKAALLKENVDKLKEKIRECSPNMVLLLGPGPLKHLTGYDNLGDYRGHYLPISDLGVKVLATYKPSVAIRQRHVDKDQKPGQYEALLTADVRKAIAGAAQHDAGFPNLILKTGPTYDEAIAWLDEIRENAKELAYDIETHNRVLVDCIGFAYNGNTGYCIPLWRPDGSAYWHPDERLVIFKKIKEILESDIPKIAQNSQFDTVILYEYYDIHVKNIVLDTMLLAHNLYCDLPKDLGSLMSLYANLPYHKQMLHSSSAEDRWLYNAQDCTATIHVAAGLRKECSEVADVRPHYYMVTNAAIPVIVDMQKTGVAVNEEYRQEAIKHELQIKADLQEAFEEVFPVHLNTKKSGKKIVPAETKFNPNSSKQKIALFYDLLGVRKKYNKGAVTTDKKFLEGLMESHSKESVRLLAEACHRYSLANSTASQLSSPLYNGRMHTAYSLGGVSEDADGEDLGTDTGRLASKLSYFYVQDSNGKWVKAGANLQNRKKGHQRRILSPEPGEEFCLVDLWAAEAYLVALDAQEEKLLSMLNKGIKIHNWLLERTVEKWPKECEAAGYSYKGAKGGVHSMNYDAQPGIIAKSSGLPQIVADWQYAFYHGEFPGIKLRMKRIREQIQKTRSITSFLGRRIFFVQPWSDELLKRAYAWPTQSTIGELAIIAMTKIWYQGRLLEPFMFPSLNTHDGLAIRCKLGTREEVTKRVADAFYVPLFKGDYRVAVPVEITWGKNFNDAEKESTKIIRYNQDGTYELHT